MGYDGVFGQLALLFVQTSSYSNCSIYSCNSIVA